MGLCCIRKETNLVPWSSRKNQSCHNRKFGIGADSLDDSDLEDNDEEDKQDDLEDQNAAIIRFVNEVILKAIVDRATDIHFEPHKETLQIRYRIDGQLVPVRVPDNLRSFFSRRNYFQN